MVAPEPFAECLECQGAAASKVSGLRLAAVCLGHCLHCRSKVGMIPGAKEESECSKDQWDFFRFGKLRELMREKEVVGVEKGRSLPNILPFCSFCARISK